MWLLCIVYSKALCGSLRNHAAAGNGGSGCGCGRLCKYLPVLGSEFLAGVLYGFTSTTQHCGRVLYST